MMKEFGVGSVAASLGLASYVLGYMGSYKSFSYGLEPERHIDEDQMEWGQ